MLFVVDSMLGALARYLRIMGFDTWYSSHYSGQELSRFVTQGRILLTRKRSRSEHYENCVLVDADRVKDQLKMLDNSLRLPRNHEQWFSRCIRCNTLLCRPDLDLAKENVPDFVFFNHKEKILWCTLCNRFYWPGTHRKRMVQLLKDWGF